MEIVLIVVVAGAALLCPLTMLGPMLLRRVGVLKGTAGQMNCMMMGDHKSSASGIDALRERRREIDREIESVEATLTRREPSESPRR